MVLVDVIIHCAMCDKYRRVKMDLKRESFFKHEKHGVTVAICEVCAKKRGMKVNYYGQIIEALNEKIERDTPPLWQRVLIPIIVKYREVKRRWLKYIITFLKKG